MKETNDLGMPEDRRAWVDQNLGQGWAEFEPGIYRFTPQSDRLTETGIPMVPPTDPGE